MTGGSDPTERPPAEPETVGDSDVAFRHRLRFLAGVVIGSTVRAIEWLVPARVERAVKRLLP